MPLYILDTNMIDHLRQNHPRAVARAALVPRSDIVTTVISVEEQIKGWYHRLHLSTRPQDIELAYQRLGETVQFFNGLRLINYSVAAVNRFLTIRKMRLNIDPPDMRIAAIALEYQAIVVTANVRDFLRVPGVVVEDWTQ